MLKTLRVRGQQTQAIHLAVHGLRLQILSNLHLPAVTVVQQLLLVVQQLLQKCGGTIRPGLKIDNMMRAPEPKLDVAHVHFHTHCGMTLKTSPTS